MPDKELVSVSDIALELKNNLSDIFEQLGEVAEVPAGTTNHGVNSKCCTYSSDINGILNSYSRSAVRDAEKITEIDDQLAFLDQTLTSKM